MTTTHTTPPAGFGYEDGGLVPITEDVDEELSEPSPMLSVALQFIGRAPTPAAIGQRAILLQAILTPVPLRELGERLQCSHTAARSRLSKFRDELRGELADFEP